MIGLTLNLARRVMGLIIKGNNNKVSQLADLLKVNTDRLVSSSVMYTRNAKAKNLPYKPIFEPREYLRRKKGKPTNIYLKPKGSDSAKPYFSKQNDGPLFATYDTKRSITGKGKRTLGDYLLEQYKGSAIL
jgi:hypothetical protein